MNNAATLVYSDPKGRDLAFRVIDADTGNVFSPSAKGFVDPSPMPPTPEPRDTLFPLRKMDGADFIGVLYGRVPNLPPMSTPGQYVASIHLASGGLPVAFIGTRETVTADANEFIAPLATGG